MAHRAFSLFGNLAVVNFPKETSKSEKIKFAKDLLKKNKNIKSVLEKSEKFKGRLRKMQTKWVTGEKTKEVLYKENNCLFRFNIDTTYFSSRLSNERKEIASKIKKNDKVLVMFAGVGPYPIVIAKNSKSTQVFSNELNKAANKYCELNINLNKVGNKVQLVPGDIKKVVENSKKGRLREGNRRLPRFDVIVMPRPQLKNSFLKQAFKLSKKGTRIFYYDFCKIEDKQEIVEKIKEEAKKVRKKIKIIKIKHAGEIAPYKVRLRVDFRVL